MKIFDATLFPLGVGIAAILVALLIIRWILRKDAGTERMKEVSKNIVIGTSAYLKWQIKTIFLVMPGLAL
jgi:Na+/H+-translocating membrane pyrophosphatase